MTNGLHEHTLTGEYPGEIRGLTASYLPNTRQIILFGGQSNTGSPCDSLYSISEDSCRYIYLLIFV